ncbi:ubiquinol-cytochrome c reductase iron-sulfur subunit [Allostreptomyces psammosilenae]|uniref:Cytochrome bc1 complex Rieske iron-sulfur subunit n=2 Tax=Allostreptomyces psammosilenae TaxID=1892865 RepID=A0A852ZY88_9ACTN|nr:ubiquinol-cytochrome c reductase iron-sulfur subunit [Allostreptomyces psammosilenae]
MSEELLPGTTPEGGQVATVVEDPLGDPGLPPHEHRPTDVDPRAERRAERQISLLFVLSMLATIAFIAVYVGVPKDRIEYVFPLGDVGLQNLLLGVTLGLALFFIGAGAVHWARTLMADEELVDERHPAAADEETRAATIAAFQVGAKESGMGRRGLLRNTLIGAVALVPLSGVVLLRDLGPLPERKLRSTVWEPGKLIISENTNEPIRPEDIIRGSLVFGKPEGIDGTEEHPNHERLNELAKASILLVRLSPEEIKSRQELEWSHEGIVAFSKICTHVGCPVGLYEQQTHHLLCPCHQSTFDLSDDGRVIFGPASRSLPQLRIQVNSEGYLEAAQDFAEPVGPSFWERG